VWQRSQKRHIKKKRETLQKTLSPSSLPRGAFQKAQEYALRDEYAIQSP
jgi:hypothetical protein